MRANGQGYPDILRAACAQASVLQLAERLSRHEPTSIKTLAGSAKGLLVSALYSLGDRPVMVVVPEESDVDAYVHDIGVFVGAEHVGAIHGAIRQSALEAGGVVHHEQMDTITRMHERRRFVLVASSSALTLHLPAANEISQATMTITRGESLPYEDTVTSLILSGFERTDYVGKPGEIAIRGVLS